MSLVVQVLFYTIATCGVLAIIAWVGYDFYCAVKASRNTGSDGFEYDRVEVCSVISAMAISAHTVHRSMFTLTVAFTVGEMDVRYPNLGACTSTVHVTIFGVYQSSYRLYKLNPIQYWQTRRAFLGLYTESQKSNRTSQLNAAINRISPAARANAALMEE